MFSVNPDNRPSVGQLSYDSESLNKMALSPVKAWPSGSQFSDNEYGPSPGVSPSSSPRSSKKSANNNLYHPPPSTDDESGDDSKGGKEPVSSMLNHSS